MKQWNFASRRGRIGLLVLVAGLVLIGCADVAYYGQALNGHWQMIEQRRSVSAVLADASVGDELRERLEVAGRLRDFASETLLLPNNGSYRSYVDLGRPHVVYNVFAAPELSLQPRSWCFPFVGCVSYRGYFDNDSATEYAEELRAEKFDTFIGGVPAYSTLGWFDDPLLNTFVRWPVTRLAELIFHELAHQRLYIANDTAFNESLASAIGQLGTELWLQDNPGAQKSYQQFRRYRNEFLDLVMSTKNDLAHLYASNLTARAKREGKRKLYAELRQNYELLKTTRWDGYSGYDGWFGEDLNNAKLAAFSAYSHYVPAFIALYHSVGKDFDAFYRAAEQLGELSFDEREQRLQALMESAPAEAPKTAVTSPRGIGAEHTGHDGLDRTRRDA